MPAKPGIYNHSCGNQIPAFAGMTYEPKKRPIAVVLNSKHTLQKPAHAFLSERGSWFAIRYCNIAGDQDMPRCAAAVDEPVKFEALAPLLQMYFFDRCIEFLWVNYDYVGLLALFNNASVQTKPAGKFTRKAPDGLFNRHDRFT